MTIKRMLRIAGQHCPELVAVIQDTAGLGTTQVGSGAWVLRVVEGRPVSLRREAVQAIGFEGDSDVKTVGYALGLRKSQRPDYKQAPDRSLRSLKRDRRHTDRGTLRGAVRRAAENQADPDFFETPSQLAASANVSLGTLQMGVDAGLLTPENGTLVPTDRGLSLFGWLNTIIIIFLAQEALCQLFFQRAGLSSLFT